MTRNGTVKHSMSGSGNLEGWAWQVLIACLLLILGGVAEVFAEEAAGARNAIGLTRAEQAKANKEANAFDLSSVISKKIPEANAKSDVDFENYPTGARRLTPTERSKELEEVGVLKKGVSL